MADAGSEKESAQRTSAAPVSELSQRQSRAGRAKRAARQAEAELDEGRCSEFNGLLLKARIGSVRFSRFGELAKLNPSVFPGSPNLLNPNRPFFQPRRTC